MQTGQRVPYPLRTLRTSLRNGINPYQPMRQNNLKSRYLKYLGYDLADHESANDAFDRMRQTNPDAFPVPRYYESFEMAVADVLKQTGY